MPGSGRRKWIFVGAFSVVALAGGGALLSSYLEGRKLGSESAVALTPEGLCVSGRNDGCWVEDVVRGERVRKLPGLDGKVNRVAVDASGRVAAAVGSGRLAVFDIASGEERMSTTGIWGVLALSADGSRVALGADDLRVYDTSGGRLVAALGEPFEREGGLDVRPDGRRVAFTRRVKVAQGARSLFALLVWDLETGSKVELLRSECGSEAVVFDPTGRRLAVNDYHAVKLIDAETGAPIWMSDPQPANVYTIVFDREGKRLACGDGNGNVRVLAASTGARLADFPAKADEGGAYALAFAPDGQRLFAVSVLGWLPASRVIDGIPAAPPGALELEAPEPGAARAPGAPTPK